MEPVKKKRNEILEDFLANVTAADFSFADIDQFFCSLTDQNVASIDRRSFRGTLLLPENYDKHLFLLYEKIIRPILFQEIKNRDIDAAVWGLETQSLFNRLQQKNKILLDEKEGSLLEYAREIDSDHPVVFLHSFHLLFDWLQYVTHELPYFPVLHGSIEEAIGDLKLLEEMSLKFNALVQEGVRLYCRFAEFHFEKWKEYVNYTEKNEYAYIQYLHDFGHGEWTRWRRNEIRSGIDYSCPNFPPVFSFRSLQRVPTKTSIFSKTFSSAEKAIEYAQDVDQIRKEELLLVIDSIRGRRVQAIRWTLSQLSLEFDAETFLTLQSVAKRIDVRLTTANEVKSEDAFCYRIESSDKSVSHWLPAEIAEQFVGKRFQNIQLDERIARLSFQEGERLLCITSEPIQGHSLPLLKWEEDD